MKVLDAAELVLRDAGEPLHYRDITDKIFERRLWQTEGLTPWLTVNAALCRDIKHEADAARFQRVAPGVFEIALGKRETPVTEPVKPTAATDRLPAFQEYMNPMLRALRELGGSASNDELVEQVIADMELSDEVASALHGGRSNQTEVSYRMAWARTYLKDFGLLANSRRGVWALTATGRGTSEVDTQEVLQAVREFHRRRKATEEPTSLEDRADVDARDDGDVTQPGEGWRGQLLEAIRTMPADGFERLAQRILRESGFVEVKVTGRSGDEGIDGTGRLRLQGIMSFHVIFQCKRYKKSVTAPAIRDFRGAMVGRTDKGIFMTTGTFTRDARSEATRDGAPPIDLIDGEQLIDLLKELRLGVKTEMVERVTIDPEWFVSV